MKFTTYLREIQNVAVYPIASLIIFGAIFIAILFYVYGSDKKDMEDKGNIPLH